MLLLVTSRKKENAITEPVVEHTVKDELRSNIKIISAGHGEKY